MCGIAGYFDFSLRKRFESGVASAMGNAIYHRGPDSGDEWHDEHVPLALVHRRLAVIDLTPAGRQPMVSACDRYVIVFNGEIYNHREIRKDLGNVTWRGHSDTETILEAVSRLGLKNTLDRLVGMFAFAIWDRKERKLSLARDRMGEKPLYYGMAGSVFLFGSELKAICAHPAFSREIDRDSLALFVRHSCVPAPYSIYKGIFKLPPGTFITIGSETCHFDPVTYWSLADHARKRLFSGHVGTDEEVISSLDKVLGDAVASQMVADVPLGAFLSGGVDSSLVVSLMQSRSSRPVKTFTIGFNEAGYNEAVHASEVAKYLGTDHTELYISGREALSIIPQLPAIYDEPFADSSQIPTYLVSKLARQHVTVSLSGDGGDELFGGYYRYALAMSIIRKTQWMPDALKIAFSRAAHMLPPKVWDALGNTVGIGGVSDRIRKLAEVVESSDLLTVYRQLTSHWKEPTKIVIDSKEPNTVVTNPENLFLLDQFEHQMMLLDSISYMPDDILVKVDRAAMAVSLETRVPMLDYRVVEFAWGLPMKYKVRGKETKWALKQLLYRYVPQQLVERPKMGFGVPIDAWLRGPLREWAEDLLSVDRFKRDGFLHSEPIRVKWQEHLSGKRNWQYYLWDILMFQAWLDSSRQIIGGL